jgi:AraC-like DNA-binding protein
LKAVATELGFSGKNLQRKLNNEGSTFRELRDSVHCEFAKRWTGLTPGEYRIENPN